jgi:hypothetical protein
MGHPTNRERLSVCDVSLGCRGIVFVVEVACDLQKIRQRMQVHQSKSIEKRESAGIINFSK